jgi:uncharacterized membrane protein YeaQ/YmgE (transglycosylase-associated protein family)
MISLLISLVIVGLIAGFIARAVVPGKDALGVGGTILLGMVGSFIGGFLGYLLHHDSASGALQTSGLFGSIVGSIVALLIYRRTNHHASV